MRHTAIIPPCHALGVATLLLLAGCDEGGSRGTRVVVPRDAGADTGASDGGTPEDAKPEGAKPDGGGGASEGGGEGGGGGGADAGDDPVCDPADHEGCGLDALCCTLAGEAACVATDVNACEACGQGCGIGADGCRDRTCTCGDGAACSGATPVCIDGACVACDTDETVCTAQSLVCEPASHACVECTANEHCDAGSEVCDTTTHTCVQCAANDDSICALTDEVCDTSTNTCAECAANDDSACTAQGLSCDLDSGTCVDALAPWQLDCASLPTSGTDCEGGPVEVILGTHGSGWVGMFDPQDGHFLGYWKRNDLSPTATSNRYFTFTQGPDLCLWSTRDTDSAAGPGVQRWNSDGTYRDEIIPRFTHFVKDESDTDRDVIYSPGALAFTEDSVYVASRETYPDPRIVRFGLDGSFQGVVLDDGTEPLGLAVLGDGSMVIGDARLNTGGVFHLSADQSTRTPLWTETPAIRGSQVAYVGAGKLVSADYQLSGNLAEVDVWTEQREVINPFFTTSGGNNRGVWPLGNGQVLLASSSDIAIGSVDPDSVSPTGQVTELWDDLSVERAGNWGQFGRACLPQAVVDAALTEPAEETCPGVPAGAALVEEDFETGDFTGAGADRAFNGFEDPNGRGVIDDTVGANGSSKSLRIDGGDPDTWYNGLTLRTGDIQPSYIGYWTRVSAVNNYYAYLYQGFMVTNSDPTTTYQAGIGFRRDQIGAWKTRVMQDFTHDTWIHVELRNIDWDAKSYDLYIDCERVADDALFPPDAATLIQRLDFFSRDANSTVWIDELVIK